MIFLDTTNNVSRFQEKYQVARSIKVECFLEKLRMQLENINLTR